MPIREQMEAILEGRFPKPKGDDAIELWSLISASFTTNLKELKADAKRHDIYTDWDDRRWAKAHKSLKKQGFIS